MTCSFESDWEKLNIPSYPKIIKHPMDLSTMRKRLESGQYPNADKFYQDFKLMIRNCFTFNPAGTPVNLAGQELQRIFEEKWRNLPPLHPPSEDEDDDDASDSETARTSHSNRYLMLLTFLSRRRRLDFGIPDRGYATPARQHERVRAYTCEEGKEGEEAQS